MYPEFFIQDMKIKVFNADDHTLLRKGVSELIKETSFLDYVGSAADGQEALDMIRAIRPDVAILDIEMPHLSGIDVARTLINENISTQFVLLTLFKNVSFFQNAFNVGVRGYLFKDCSDQVILDCIRSVHSGKAYVNLELTQYLLTTKNVKDDQLSDLSDHEVNILRLITQLKTSAQIADMLFISPKTVANHRSNIGKKLNLSGEQNGLLKWAIKNQDLLG